MSETVDILVRAKRLNDQIAETKRQIEAARIARVKADEVLLAAKKHERAVCAALRELEASAEFLFISKLDLDKVAKEPKRIIKRVALEHGLTYEDIVGKDRSSHITTARWAAIAAVRKAHPNFSLVQIGRYFNLHHTTVMHALRSLDDPTLVTHAEWFRDLDRRILAKLLAGVPRPEIMAEFGVSRMKLTRVLKRHVPGVDIDRVNPREQEILQAFDACGKQHLVAEQLGVDRETIKRAVERREKFQAIANSNDFLKAAA